MISEISSNHNNSTIKDSTVCFSVLLSHNDQCGADSSCVEHCASLFGISQYSTASSAVWRGDNSVQSGFAEGLIFFTHPPPPPGLGIYCAFLSQLLLCSSDGLTGFYFQIGSSNNDVLLRKSVNLLVDNSPVYFCLMYSGAL